jgi:hypothetical protein
MMDVEGFLLPERHPEVRHRMAELQALPPPDSRRVASSDKWVSKHLDHYSAAGGRSWWETKPLSGLIDVYPGLREMAPREFDLLNMANFTIPGDRNMNVSQGLERGVAAPGIMPCITPGCKNIIGTRGRVLRGREGLHLQGIYYDNEDEMLSPYSNLFLMDLAGNAFNSFCCGAVFLSGLLSIAGAAEQA